MGVRGPPCDPPRTPPLLRSAVVLYVSRARSNTACRAVASALRDAQVLLFRGRDSASGLEAMAGAAQHDLQRGQQAEDVREVVVAEVGDAHDLPLQLALAAAHRPAQ